MKILVFETPITLSNQKTKETKMSNLRQGEGESGGYNIENVENSHAMTSTPPCALASEEI